MRSMLAALMVAALAAGCGGNGVEPERPKGPESPVFVALDEEFTLRAGQEVQLDGGSLRLLFREVPADSRCPVDVTCVWAGNAVVALVAFVPAGGGEPLDLNTTLEPRQGEFAGYEVRLVSLSPEPRSDTKIPAQDYTATLVVSRR